MCQAARERELRSRGGGGGGGGGEGTEEELEVSRRAWEVNYREAAIFLEEGQNNDKFIHHPRYYLLSCAKIMFQPPYLAGTGTRCQPTCWCTVPGSMPSILPPAWLCSGSASSRTPSPTPSKSQSSFTRQSSSVPCSSSPSCSSSGPGWDTPSSSG